MQQPKHVRSVVIVGGVAGGMSAATRLRRLDPTARIIVIERSGHVSYANCGLPYYVGGIIGEESELLLQTPTTLKQRFDIDVLVNHEAIAIDAAARKITVLDRGSEIEHILDYDYLVLSPGARPTKLPIPGIERALSLRTVEDVGRMAEAVKGATSAVVIGAGFIGLELAENLAGLGLSVAVIEATAQVLPPLDTEMAAFVESELRAHGVEVHTSTTVTSIREDAVVLSDGSTISASVVIAAAGVRPDVDLARSAGLTIGARGGILVDVGLRTSDPHILAVGDAVEKVDELDGSQTLIPLANIANRQGRHAADVIMGRSIQADRGVGSAVIRVFGVTVALTGWSAKRLSAAGSRYASIHTHPSSHAGYYPGAEGMHLKLIFDPANGRILGAQGVGGEGVDKRIDVLTTAMAGGIPAWDLSSLELAYAPQFGSAKDPINMLGYIAEDRTLGGLSTIQWDEVASIQESEALLVDVRDPSEFASGSIPGAMNIPLNDLRSRLSELEGHEVVAFCEVGQRGHVAQMLLGGVGITSRNLDGGYRTWSAATGQ